MRHVRVFAPGSIGNVGPGLDILGLALAGAGDTILASRTATRRIVIAEPGDAALPRAARRHAVGIAASAVLRRAGMRGRLGLELRVHKGLPLAGGQGGSAASAVAGAVAANELAGRPLGPSELLLAALEAETAVAGRHLDNVAPALLGGLVLIRSVDPPDVVRLDPPRGLVVVLAKPAYQLSTRRSRSVLPRQVPLAVALQQAANVAALLAAATASDLQAFGRAIDDRIAEPARAALLPGFVQAKRAALEAGAAGCSISGSGPTAFAVAGSVRAASRIAAAMEAAYRRAGFGCEVRITRPDLDGARVLRGGRRRGAPGL